MSEKQFSTFEQLLLSREKTVIILLCVVAVARVLVFSAAFPLFNNVDEPQHVDMVMKYAAGHPPSGIEPYLDTTIALVAYCGSSEYLTTRESIEAVGLERPPSETGNESAVVRADAQIAQMEEMINPESTEPPLYYTAAGLWYRLGELLVSNQAKLVYWTRLLNAPILALTTLVSWAFIRRYLPQNVFVRFGAPFVVALMPQDLFYGVNNCVLSALLGAITLYLAGLIYAGDPSWRTCMAAGLAAAASFLTKTTNAPVVAMLGAIVLIKLWSMRGTRNSVFFVRLLAVVAICTALPVGAWMARNIRIFGDAMAYKQRIRVMDWTPVPLLERWHHPIFTPAGVSTFYKDLAKTAWRGEFYWYGTEHAAHWIDWFYPASTAIFLLVAAIWVTRSWKRLSREAMWAYAASAGTALVLTGMLAWLSVSYNYGTCMSPSVSHPYFSGSRLIYAGLAPFIVLYLTGMNALLGAMRLRRFRWVLLMLMMATITVSEIAISTPVFRSNYNLFHM